MAVCRFAGFQIEFLGDEDAEINVRQNRLHTYNNIQEYACQLPGVCQGDLSSGLLTFLSTMTSGPEHLSTEPGNWKSSSSPALSCVSLYLLTPRRRGRSSGGISPSNIER